MSEVHRRCWRGAGVGARALCSTGAEALGYSGVVNWLRPKARKTQAVMDAVKASIDKGCEPIEITG